MVRLMTTVTTTVRSGPKVEQNATLIHDYLAANGPFTGPAADLATAVGITRNQLLDSLDYIRAHAATTGWTVPKLGTGADRSFRLLQSGAPEAASDATVTTGEWPPTPEMPSLPTRILDHLRLAGEPVSTQVIKTVAGEPPASSLSRALRRLSNEHLIERTGNGVYQAVRA